MKRLVLLGGGHSQLAVLARFAREPAADTEIVLVSPARHALYSGMIPGWIAGDYAFEDCRIDLQPLAERAGARRIEVRAAALDADARRVMLEDGSAIGYDLLAIDVGSAAARTGIAGTEQAIALRPIEAIYARLAEFDARVRTGNIARLAVIGAGAAGVEVLLCLMHRCATLLQRPVQGVLIGDANGLLPGHGCRARDMVRHELERRGAELHIGTAVRAVNAEDIALADGSRLAADAAILATGAAPHAWLAASALARDEQGFIATDAKLRSTSHPEVLAAGDCATQVADPRPKSGVHAVRQGPVLAANLAALLQRREPQSFRCPTRALALFNLGGKRAVASWGGLAAGGRWVWRWKDALDRSFVDGYGA